MIGTLFNCFTILIGSFIGRLMNKGLNERFQTILMQAMGFAAAALGINAIVQNMPHSVYPVLFIVSLALGGLIGEWLDMEKRFHTFVNRFSQGPLAKGLSTAILLFCVGTLSIVGPIESALHHNHTYLFTNALLDLVTSAVLASTFGFGIALSAIALFIWQGFFFVLALLLRDFMTPELLTELGTIGGILIFSSGLSILGIEKLKTLNLVPALIIPPLFFIIIHFI